MKKIAVPPTSRPSTPTLDHRHASPLRPPPVPATALRQTAVVAQQKFPQICPFSAKDHKVQVLFQLQGVGINFAESERLRHLRSAIYDQLLVGAQRALLEMLMDDFDHHIKADDIWVQFRPGQIQSILLNFEDSPTPDAARIDDATWPIRIYAAVRCSNPDDAALIAEALQDFADDELAFHDFLELYQRHTRRLADTCLTEIVDMDAPATLLGTVYAPPRGDRTSTVEGGRSVSCGNKIAGSEYFLKVQEVPQ